MPEAKIRIVAAGMGGRGAWAAADLAQHPAFDLCAMVDTLRDAYAVVDRVDPTTPAYHGVCRLLDQMSQDDLKMLRDANIRWLSSLADERVKL